MATKLLINTQEDYADEFNYPVISLFNSALKNYLILKGFHYLKDSDFNKMYFGSNEALQMNKEQVRRMIANATELSDEEYKYAYRFLKNVPCLDIVDRIIDTVYDRMSQEDPDELANYDAILEEHG